MEEVEEVEVGGGEGGACEYMRPRQATLDEHERVRA